MNSLRVLLIALVAQALGSYVEENQDTTIILTSTRTVTSTITTISVPNPSSTETEIASTTTKVCRNSTVTHLPENKCNVPKGRGIWCNDKSIDSDTQNEYYSGETKYFDFVITNTTIDFDGKAVQSFAINGQSPGPIIEVNWGDRVIVEVTNLMENNGTTLHWHGIRQTGTNDQDGVPGVSECGIAPGTTRTYSWHASTYGTGWYHSHMMAQFGGGIRGPIIVHGPATGNYDIEMGAVMIDDIFDGTIFQTGWKSSHVGVVNSTNYLLNGRNKSPDMTRGEHQRWTLKSGKKHRFRLINSSSQTAYAVHFDSHMMKVIAADFTPIVPYETEWLYIQNGQRYDIIIEANQPKSAYYLRAVTQIGCPSICKNNGLGKANGIIEYEGTCGEEPIADLGNAKTTDFTSCKDEPLTKLVPYVKKNGGTLSQFQESVKTINGGNGAPVVIGDNHRVFRWYLNGNKTMKVNFTQPTLKTLATMPKLDYNRSIYSQAVPLLTEENEWVYFVIQNQFSVSHPMHLHGHDYSILGQGPGIFDSSMANTLNFDNPMRRDTGLLFGTSAQRSGYTVIGFQTDNPGAWVMHCHIAWHSDGGMALQFVERPDAIDAKGYYGKKEFKEECETMEQYEAEGDHRRKPEYESGLKKRLSKRKREHEAFFHGYHYGKVIRN